MLNEFPAAPVADARVVRVERDGAVTVQTSKRRCVVVRLPRTFVPRRWAPLCAVQDRVFAQAGGDWVVLAGTSLAHCGAYVVAFHLQELVGMRTQIDRAVVGLEFPRLRTCPLYSAKGKVLIDFTREWHAVVPEGTEREIDVKTERAPGGFPAVLS